MAEKREQSIGRAAWEAVHDHGAFRRDFPDEEYYEAVGDAVIAVFEKAHAPTDDERSPEFEALEQELFKHQPVLSMSDGSIAGCQCMDRVFHKRVEDWGTHLAEVFEALRRSEVPELSTPVRITIEHEGGNTITGTPEQVLNYAHLMPGWKYRGLEPQGEPSDGQPSVEVLGLGDETGDVSAAHATPAGGFSRQQSEVVRAQGATLPVVGHASDRTSTQGEPSDAAVIAAAREFEWVWNENIDSFDPEQHDASTYIQEAMRAALRAAHQAGQGENRG